MARKIVWRVSMVREYSAEHPSSETPDPICEIRAFVFLENKPTVYEYKLLKEGLTQVINYTENLFYSIYIADEKGLLTKTTSEDPEITEIRTVIPATPRIVFEIDGYEVEKIDLDEVTRHFKDDVTKAKFNEIYRYCGFYDQHTKDIDPSKEYDEYSIVSIERVT